MCRRRSCWYTSRVHRRQEFFLLEREIVVGLRMRISGSSIRLLLSSAMAKWNPTENKSHEMRNYKLSIAKKPASAEHRRQFTIMIATIFFGYSTGDEDLMACELWFAFNDSSRDFLRRIMSSLTRTKTTKSARNRFSRMLETDWRDGEATKNEGAEEKIDVIKFAFFWSPEEQIKLYNLSCAIKTSRHRRR